MKSPMSADIARRPWVVEKLQETSTSLGEKDEEPMRDSNLFTSHLFQDDLGLPWEIKIHWGESFLLNFLCYCCVPPSRLSQMLHQ